MKTIRIMGPIACALLACAAAGAQTITVQHTMDYRDNVWADKPSDGLWFAEPDLVLDHSPFHAGSDEDWGWIHDVSAIVPVDATGIASATLTIVAWDVDPWSLEPREGEQDVIYADGIQLGLLDSYVTSPIAVPWSGTGQVFGYENYWSKTSFDLPADVLDTLWTNSQLYVFMDIDRIRSINVGHRVTLKDATLTVRYVFSGTAPPPQTVPVYRFWSPVTGGHFYTTDEQEKQSLIDDHPDVWMYETVAYRALPDDQVIGAMPVYRFWSPVTGGHFYTMDDAERDWLLADYPDVWIYEDIAYYAYPEGSQPLDAVPVYRFWSDMLGRHFYTTDEVEKQGLLDTYPDVWTYETIAWYAHAP